ncbi:MAG TPA: hypothetical protein VEU47_04425 [Candidatus Cybelea sp.]|nr:hypothetical protein [Candidatus Cybelea sp.]
MDTLVTQKPLQSAVAIDLAEAAERLGLSLKTLEVILQHGILNGYQDTDGRWKVILDADGAIPAPRSPENTAAGQPRSPVELRRDAPRRSEPPPPKADVPPLSPSQGEPSKSEAPKPETPKGEAPQSPPPRPPSPPAAPPRRTEPARPPAEIGSSTVERLLAEQVEYLRGQLERREGALAEKDALVGELMRRLVKLSRTAVERIPNDHVLRGEIELTKAEQSRITERHEKAMRNLGDVLASVRDYLARQKVKDKL